MSRHTVRVDRHVHDARVHRHEVVGAEGLGHHGGISSEAALHQVVGAFPALAARRRRRRRPRSPASRTPDRRMASAAMMMLARPPFMLMTSWPYRQVALEAGRPGISRPAPGQRIDVGVAVQHPAGPAARAAQRGDGLQSPGLDLLKIDRVPALAEEGLEKERDRRLFGLEARDPDERASRSTSSRASTCPSTACGRNGSGGMTRIASTASEGRSARAPSPCLLVRAGYGECYTAPESHRSHLRP